MTLVKVNQHPLQKGFSSFFDEVLNDLPAFNSWGWNKDGIGSVPVNIYETADAFHLELNAPGRSKEDFKLNVEKGLLTIGFEKKEETKTDGQKTVRREFSYQSFKRSFTLEDGIDADNIQAKYENGLLKLVLPKKEQVKQSARQINVD
jgi:HSP20 family protein